MMQKPVLEVLISTQHRENLDFLKSMFSRTADRQIPILIINQTLSENPLVSDQPHIRVVNTRSTGLSNSRNLALEYAQGDWLLLCDDDVILEPDFDQKIRAQLPIGKTDVGLYVFRALKDADTWFRKYPKAGPLTFLQAISLCSIEMVVNREAIQEQQLKFDTLFGLGALFSLGEEAVFTADLWRGNWRVIHSATPIVLHTATASPERASNPERYFIVGAVFFRIFRASYGIPIARKIASDLRNQQLTWSGVSRCLHQVRKGKKAYQQQYEKNNSSGLCSSCNSENRRS